MWLFLCPHLPCIEAVIMDSMISMLAVILSSCFTQWLNHDYAAGGVACEFRYSRQILLMLRNRLSLDFSSAAELIPNFLRINSSRKNSQSKNADARVAFIPGWKSWKGPSAYSSVDQCTVSESKDGQAVSQHPLPAQALERLCLSDHWDIVGQ